jgi:hypothetical protein
MELIDNADQAHKMYSVIGAVLLAVFDTVHVALPSVQDFISPATFAAINIVAAVGIAVARVLKQPNL